MYDPIIRIIDKYNNNIKPAKGFSDKCSDVAYPGYYHYVNRTQECVPQCGSDILYEKEDKKFAEGSTTSFEKYLIVNCSCKNIVRFGSRCGRACACWPPASRW